MKNLLYDFVQEEGKKASSEIETPKLGFAFFQVAGSCISSSASAA